MFFELLEELDLKDGMDQFFSGAKINVNEDRAVLHPALRGSTSSELEFAGNNVQNLVNTTLGKVEKFLVQKFLLNKSSESPEFPVLKEIQKYTME